MNEGETFIEADERVRYEAATHGDLAGALAASYAAQGRPVRVLDRAEIASAARRVAA